MKINQLNHVAIHVADLDTSMDFYRNVLGLKPIQRPAFNFPGAWFGIGKDQELHLIAGRSEPVVANRRGTHFAVQIDSMEAAEVRLKEHEIPYHEPKTRPDGALQIYIEDPDGHVIELAYLKEIRKPPE